MKAARVPVRIRAAQANRNQNRLLVRPCRRMYEVVVKRGHAVCRCGFDEELDRRSVEIPTWMLESAVCSRVRVAAVPSVCCDALLELPALLRVATCSVGRVLPAQQHSLESSPSVT